MAWLESHQELARHPKTKKFARIAEIDLPTAVGYLHLLWWWAMDYAQDGDLTKWCDEDISEAALWSGNPTKFVEALMQSGFIDRNEDKVEIHDWRHYAGKLIEQRETQAKYKKRKYALYNDLRLTKEIKKRDGNTCQYCGKTVNWDDRRGKNGGTYDRVDPDGENDLDNLVVCCRSCSIKKGNRTPEQARMSFAKDIGILKTAKDPAEIRQNPDGNTADSDDTVRKDTATNDMKMAKVAEAYQLKIGSVLSSQILMAIETSLDAGMSPDVLILAADKAVDAGVPTGRYVSAILRDWRAQGVKTLADVARNDKTLGSGKTQKNRTESQPKRTFADIAREEMMAHEQSRDGDAAVNNTSRLPAVLLQADRRGDE
jgi:DnaD/phage-associated family protein